MATQDLVSQDIFAGAEKVEVLGRLPTFLWGYTDAGRDLTKSLEANPDEYQMPLTTVQKILGILLRAAEHLGNKDLQDRLNGHVKMLADLSSGAVSPSDFKETFSADLLALQGLAGPRPDYQGEGLSAKKMLEQELDKVERIRTGRSSDLIVGDEILADIRGYLTKEVLVEGISTVLLIDNAGTLICNVGNKLEMDVVALAAVAAANFAATEKIANIIGEQDFVLLFYKGHSESFHFSRVTNEYIIVTIFNNEMSLGLLRLKITEVAQALEKKLPKREG